MISHNCAEHAFHEMELTLKPDAINFAFGDVKDLWEQYKIDCVTIHKRMGCKPRYCIKELEKHGVCLMGNINPNVFARGAYADIEHEVKSCMEAAPDRGFILSTGCEIPLNTSVKEMETLWQAMNSRF